MSKYFGQEAKFSSKSCASKICSSQNRMMEGRLKAVLKKNLLHNVYLKGNELIQNNIGSQTNKY